MENASSIAALEARVKLAEIKLDTAVADYNEALDTIWMLLAGLLVFFMHAGFSFLEAGSVRLKNVQNILAKNLVVATAGFLCWWAVGYALALGTVDDGNKFIGSKGFFMEGFWDDKTIFRMWFFQGAFCATGATIVSGAMAERVQIKGFISFTIVMTSFIYPVVVFWCWSGQGFLNYKNKKQEAVSVFGAKYLDFAGSGVVHMVGGVAALCGALVVGPRKGRFDDPNAEDEEFMPHNIPFCVLGTFCLWVGWFGFNPGSTLEMHTKASAQTAGLAAVNSVLSPCVSGLVVFFFKGQVLSPRRLDVGAFCNGILAGLVAITAGCANLRPWEAAFIGLIAGFMYLGASALVLRLRVDDVVDAFAVHGANGFWGILALGLFGNPSEGIGGNGAFYGGDQLVTQLMAALIIAAWTAVLSVVVLVPMKKLGALRLSEDFQDAGADAMEHSPAKAYAAGAVPEVKGSPCSPSRDPRSPSRAYEEDRVWQC